MSKHRVKSAKGPDPLAGPIYLTIQAQRGLKGIIPWPAALLLLALLQQCSVTAVANEANEDLLGSPRRLTTATS